MPIQAIYLFIAAVVLAFLEVQIEGKHGWADKLPTWRPNGSLADRVYRRLMGGKSLTGYHLGVFGVVLLFLHYPFFAGIDWSLPAELWVVSLFFMFAVVWDYIWIIINPHYGVVRRRPQADVWWHKHWWGPFPRDYYFGLLLSVLALWPLWRADTAVLYEWLWVLGVFVVGTVAVLAVTELLRGDIER